MEKVDEAMLALSALPRALGNQKYPALGPLPFEALAPVGQVPEEPPRHAVVREARPVLQRLEPTGPPLSVVREPQRLEATPTT
jgi:hypothetical protein